MARRRAAAAAIPTETDAAPVPSAALSSAPSGSAAAASAATAGGATGVSALPVSASPSTLEAGGKAATGTTGSLAVLGVDNSRGVGSASKAADASTHSTDADKDGPDKWYTPWLRRSMGQLYGDRMSVAILLALYTLQGVPMGLAGSIPLMLAGKGAKFSDQAIFSLVSYPYALKLFWAPLVDATRLPGIGRRKSWIVPIQLAVGIMLLMLSSPISAMVDTEGATIQIGRLTAIFFAFYFLAATQDIAVDGWALTMLKPQNVGYGSTCNTIGQLFGYMMSYSMFMALNSAEFCNKYLRSEPQPTGVVTLSGYMQFWGVVFIGLTLLIAIFKSEPVTSSADEPSVGQCYRDMWAIIKMKPVLILTGVLLTCKIGFSALDSALAFELIELGIPKEHLAVLAVVFLPFELTFPVLVGNHTAGAQPLSFFMRAYLPRLIIGAVITTVTLMMGSGGNVGGLFYVTMFCLMLMYRMASSAMFLSLMSFYAKVSDPAIGGTYMTMLNTLTNLGGQWVSQPVLASIDHLTLKHCVAPDNTIVSGATTAWRCSAAACSAAGGACVQWLDGFETVTYITLALGLVWFLVVRKYVLALEARPITDWRIQRTSSFQ